MFYFSDFTILTILMQGLNSVAHPDNLFILFSSSQNFLVAKKSNFQVKGKNSIAVSRVCHEIFNVRNIHLRQSEVHQTEQLFVLNKSLLFCTASRLLLTRKKEMQVNKESFMSVTHTCYSIQQSCITVNRIEVNRSFLKRVLFCFSLLLTQKRYFQATTQRKNSPTVSHI